MFSVRSRLPCGQQRRGCGRARLGRHPNRATRQLRHRWRTRRRHRAPPLPCEDGPPAHCKHASTRKEPLRDRLASRSWSRRPTAVPLWQAAAMDNSRDDARLVPKTRHSAGFCECLRPAALLTDSRRAGSRFLCRSRDNSRFVCRIRWSTSGEASPSASRSRETPRSLTTSRPDLRNTRPTMTGAVSP